MKESKVNIRKLIKTLREDYDIPEGEEWRIAINELIANSIDSFEDKNNTSNRIEIKTYNEKEHIRIICEDNGSGMDYDKFENYHDILAISKTRYTQTIGFVGIGAKLTLDICDHVYTETKKAGCEDYLNSTWKFEETDIAPKYEIVKTKSKNKMKYSHGTYVEISGLKCKPISEADLISHILEEYQHIFDIMKINIRVNDQELYSVTPKEDQINEIKILNEKLKIKHEDEITEQRITGKLYFVKDDYKDFLKDKNLIDNGGIDIVLYGKTIIKERFNLIQMTDLGNAQYIHGYVSFDPLIETVRNTKDDFNRKNHIWKTFESKMNEILKNWLVDLGISKEIDEELPIHTPEVDTFLKILKERFKDLFDALVLNKTLRGKIGENNIQNGGKGDEIKVQSRDGSEILNIDHDAGGVLIKGTFGGENPGSVPSLITNVPDPLSEKPKLTEEESKGEKTTVNAKHVKESGSNIKIIYSELPDDKTLILWDSTTNSFKINKTHPAWKFHEKKGKNVLQLFAINLVIGYLLNENEKLSQDDNAKKEKYYQIYASLLGQFN
jgi:anti-sigma regulatory factor (Ser/Thr protein kinase)